MTVSFMQIPIRVGPIFDPASLQARASGRPLLGPSYLRVRRGVQIGGIRAHRRNNKAQRAQL